MLGFVQVVRLIQEKKKLTRSDCRGLFDLTESEMKRIPCRQHHNRFRMYYLYSVSTVAKEAVKKHGSLRALCEKTTARVATV